MTKNKKSLPSVWIFGNEYGQDTANHPKYGTEQNDG